MRPRWIRRLGVILLACTGLVPGPAARALDRPAAMHQYVQTTLTDHNGLPQNSVNAVAQTPDGYLWFGTEEGLARFDGLHMTVFDVVHYKALRDNFIDALAAGRDGSLWIGTRSGITRLKDGVFHSYLTARSPITAICESSDGAIWVGGLDGLYRLSGGDIRHYTTADGLPTDGISSIVQGRDGTLWLGTNKGLASLKDSVFYAYGFINGLSTDAILGLAPSQDGSLWIATAQGLLRWNGELAETQPSVQIPPHARIGSLVEGRNGTLWMGFDHAGIASLANGEFSRYTAAQGLPSDDIGQLFEDRNGNLWAGLFEGGAVELRDSSFTTFGKREGLSEDMVWSVLQARDGSIWVGTNNRGVNHIDGTGHVEVYGSREGLPGGSIFALWESADTSLWIGSEHGELSHLEHGHITVFRDPANRGARLNSIFADANGDLLLGYHEINGLVRFHQGRFQHVQVPGLLNAVAMAPDGSIWIGTDHGGVSHLVHGGVTTLTTRNGLLSNFAQAVYVDRDGVVWAGTSPGGLNRIAGGHITTWSIDQGLFDLTVGAIVEDDQGYLWMTCNRGIYKVAKKELNDFAAGRIAAIHSIAYTTADGLRSAECNFAANPSVWKGADGHLWFVTTAGIVTVDPARSQVRTIHPSPLIEQVRFNRRDLPFAQGVTAGPGSGDMEIQFTAPDFVAPERVRFRYRLGGFDAEWTDAGERREAIYTKLPPGRYVFELQAADGDHGWMSASASASLSIAVIPHFWQTAWFRTLCACLLVLAGFALYRLRVRYLVEHARELEEKVTVRTAELQLAKQAAEGAQRALRDLATRDSLTELWNRRALFEMLETEIARARRERLPVTVLMVDLDHFKQINDTYGHLTGDAVLQEVARRITHHIRPYDFAGRYGGEEFLIILPGCTSVVGLHRAECLRRAISDTPISTEFGDLTVTCSLGVATHTDEISAEDLIRAADEALYCAKRVGRNRVQTAV